MDKITDANVISELQAGTMILKRQRYELIAENENLKKRYIEAVNDMASLKRQIVKLDQALKDKQ